MDGGPTRDKLIIFVEKRENPDDRLLVFFPSDTKKIGVKPIRQSRRVWQLYMRRFLAALSER